MDLHRITAITCLLAGPASAAEPTEMPEPAALEAGGYVIGEIVLDREDVFDLSNPEEDKWLYRAANRLHIDTRPGTIRKQLLFAPGDPYDARVIEESERILRQNKYLYDADIRAVRAADGKVDLVVETRDVWSLAPEFSISRSGGETRSRIGLEETNLLGRGQLLRFLRDDDIDRSEKTVEFADRHLGKSWVSLLASYSDNSDGDASRLTVTRPFYSLDTRWAAGGNLLLDDRRSKIYQFGEAAVEYRHQRDYAYLFGGWSKGLRGGKVMRWTAGAVYDDNRFSDPLVSDFQAFTPADRKLVYPWLGFEFVEDAFVTTANHDQIERTEDFQMGWHINGGLGWADRSLGSDRDAAIFWGSASRGFGSLKETALLLDSATSGRVESGKLANSKLSIHARFYHRQSEKRTFFMSLGGIVGDNLDLDNLVELGGKTGMRGYPLRYQVGESRMVATIEQRFYTDWYPFRFARVGAAVFADAGRVWGPNPLGEDNRGWMTDVGVGLRFALTRVASGRVVHLDLAFPMNGDPTIDSVQILLESRKSF